MEPLTVWRLIRLETCDASTNMAIDEAVLRARIAGKAPNTLRFYRWRPSAVSIGRFQSVANEVDLDACRKRGVDVVRRITGGGAVYHDSEDEITYSVVMTRDDLGEVDVTEAYKKICCGLINALELLGVKAEFSPGDTRNCPNVTVNGRKISGSSQSFKGGMVLQHGTILLRVNLEKMFTFLRVPWAKTCMEIVNVAEKKITSVRDELGIDISVEEAYKALVKGFKDAFRMRFIEGVLTREELEATEKLRKEKYANQDWTILGASAMI
ncbi:MAG: lipoate--protein ligase family protein [Candidatus Bathyarchaeales archaeon]